MSCWSSCGGTQTSRSCGRSRTLRFDVYAVPDEPDAIFLYEMYASDVAFAADRDGEPYKRFVDHIVPNVVDKMDFLFRSASSGRERRQLDLPGQGVGDGAAT